MKNRNEEERKLCEEYTASVDRNGNLILPPQIVKFLGATENAQLKIDLNKDRVEIYPDIHTLARVYIEPTSKCNLKCHTCIRNTWDEPLGDMDLKVFDRLVEQLKDLKHLQSVMFGGFGEPTAHRDILYMIKRIKSLGVKTEIVTNGTLLNEKFLKGLIDSKLDKLWVSFDSTEEIGFEEVREGANYNSVVANLKLLKRLNKESNNKIEIGIAFVVMKQNVDDLQHIHRFARKIGAKEISVSNVLPYTREMQNQVLYDMVITQDSSSPSMSDVLVNLPRFDINNETKESLYKMFRNNSYISFMTNKTTIKNKTCRFIKERCTFIRWDGKVSPCMGLLHSYITFLNNTERKIEAYNLGDVSHRNLSDIWDSKEYIEFREKVNRFDFSPCYTCGGCELVQSNKEDCFGNKFPCCGGCMWAHGVIQCP